MNQGRYVFSQVTVFLPQMIFDGIVKKYGGNRYVRHFTCWNQLLCRVMRYIQVPIAASPLKLGMDFQILKSTSWKRSLVPLVSFAYTEQIRILFDLDRWTTSMQACEVSNAKKINPSRNFGTKKWKNDANIAELNPWRLKFSKPNIPELGLVVVVL